MSDTYRPTSNPPISHMSSLSPGGASLTTEQERDFFKDRVEHFKILVRNLQEEVQSYKLRKEGTATVSKLLQESKQEVVALTKKNRAYESVIRILQSRLEKHGLSSEITLLDDEQYLPSNSRSLIDNLTRENKRLRNVIKTSNTGDPEEFARLQQALNESNQANGDLQSRIVELENLLRASDNDKDQTITQLREELSHLNRELSARNLKCSTLAKEAENLQKQLEDVAYQCHDLAKRLREQSSMKSTETTETTRKEEVPMDVNEDTVALNEENKALKRRVQEITDMNKRWQEYNKQRELYVSQITGELNELKSNQAQQNSSASREFEVQMNHVLDDARKHIDEAQRQKTQVQKQLDNANRSIISLTDELRVLKQQRSSASNPDADETIQALKAQIQICTEDFESERKDREKAQTKISRQESELLRLRKEVDDLRRQREHWQSSPQVQPAPQSTYTDPFYHYQQTGSSGCQSNEGLTARGVTRGRAIDQYNVIDSAIPKHDVHVEKTDVQKDVRYVNDDVIPPSGAKNRSSDEEYHSLRTSSLSSNSNRASPVPSPKRSGNESPAHDVYKPPSNSTDCLKCPKCAKEYTAKEHRELLEHIELCCE